MTTRPTHPSRSSAPRYRLAAVVATLALMAAACRTTDGNSAATSTTDDPAATTTSDPPSSTTTSQAPSTTVDPDGGDGLGETERCTNPEGFSIAYPADWSVNDGSVTTECSLFDPELFEVPDSTDARAADISAFVDDIAFARVAAPTGDDRFERAVTAVDGHQAVRLAGETSGDGLYLDGIPVTRYLIDLDLGVDDGAGTLTIDILGLDGVDYQRGREVLDLMVKTIELDADQADPATVARYEGGGTPFTVLAQADDDELCLTLADAEGQACLGSVDGTASVRAANLGDDLQPILAGTVSSDVFRIEARMSDGDAISYLPVPVPMTDGTAIGGWAFPFGRADLTELAWYDLTGDELGSRPVNQPGDGEDGPDPIGEFASVPVRTDDFPASGPQSYLTDVRVGVHDGFDRVVFELAGGHDLSYEVEWVEEVLQPSGQPIDVNGDEVISVIVTPASGVDLSGSEPEVIYTGPDRLSPGSTSAIEQLALASDFEATLVWAIGVSGDAEFAVELLDEPQRLVVDIRSSEEREQ